MKIVVLESEEWEREFFESLSQDHELIYLKDPINKGNVSLFKDAEILAPFVHSELDADVLQHLPSLKCIVTRSTGFDHIDLSYCSSHGIEVCNVPTYGENTVAEHVFALLLSLSHKMPEAITRTRQGNCSQDGLQGFDLFGKTIGVIGTGGIGLNVIRIARGFGMDVIAFDVRPNKDAAENMGFRYVAFDDLVRESDVISLHVPENEQTLDLLSDREFDMMKMGVVLINTSRGGVLNIKALLKGLASGKVGCAGLDVLPEEPVIREEAELLRSFFAQEHSLENLLADHILLRMKNVIVTPHSAFNTKEAVERILKTTCDNINGFVTGQIINSVL